MAGKRCAAAHQVLPCQGCEAGLELLVVRGPTPKPSPVLSDDLFPGAVPSNGEGIAPGARAHDVHGIWACRAMRPIVDFHHRSSWSGVG